MRAAATTLPRYIGQPKATAIKTLSKRGFLNHCRYLVESTDWDEKFLDQEKWINRICLAIVIISTLYFTPVLILSLLR